MNKQTAQLEAERRWGNGAHAWIVAGVRYVSHDITSNFGSGWKHFNGCGNSWEEAFADADRRSEPEPAGSRDRDEWKHEAAQQQRLK